jgi:hypothetical protein
MACSPLDMNGTRVLASEIATDRREPRRPELIRALLERAWFAVESSRLKVERSLVVVQRDRIRS